MGAFYFKVHIYSITEDIRCRSDFGYMYVCVYILYIHITKYINTHKTIGSKAVIKNY